MSLSLLYQKRQRSNEFITSSNNKPKKNLSYDSCFICKEKVFSSTSIIVKCLKCQNNFHFFCYEHIKSPSKELEIKSISKCRYCGKKEKDICINCDAIINYTTEIKITCELCGSKIHYHCLYIPFSYLFRRSYYASFFSKESKDPKYIKLISIIEQYDNDIFEREKEIDAFNKLLSSIDQEFIFYLKNTYSVCKLCLNNKGKIITKTSFKSKGNFIHCFYNILFFPFNRELHELYVNKLLYEEANPNINFNEINICNDDNEYKNSIRKIIQLDNRLIIKWVKGGYSSEIFGFIQYNQEFARKMLKIQEDKGKFLVRSVSMDLFKKTISERYHTNLLNMDKNTNEVKKVEYIENVIRKSIECEKFSVNQVIEKQGVLKEITMKPKFVIVIDNYKIKKQYWKKKIEDLLLLSTIDIFSLNEDNDTFREKLKYELQFSNKEELDIKLLSADITIISSSIQCKIIEMILATPINAVIFDIDKKEIFIYCLKLIQILFDKATDMPLIYIFYPSENPCDINFFNSIFYQKNSCLLLSSPETNKLNIYNKGINLLPLDYNSYIEYFKLKLNWNINLPTIIIGSYESLIKKEMLFNKKIIQREVNYLYNRKIIEFIPIFLSNENFQIYKRITKINLSFQENIAFLSFPHSLITTYNCLPEKISKIQIIINTYNSNTQTTFYLLYSPYGGQINNSELDAYLNNKNALIKIIDISKDNEVNDIFHKYSIQNSIFLVYNPIFNFPIFHKILNVLKECTIYYLYVHNTIEEEILLYSIINAYENKPFTKDEVYCFLNLKRKHWIYQQNPSEVYLNSDVIDGLIFTNESNFLFTKNTNCLLKRKQMQLEGNYINELTIIKEHQSLNSVISNKKIDKKRIKFQIVNPSQINVSVNNNVNVNVNKTQGVTIRDILSQIKENCDQKYMIFDFLIKAGFTNDKRAHILDFIISNGIDSEGDIPLIHSATRDIIQNFSIAPENLKFYMDFFLIGLNQQKFNSSINEFLYFNLNIKELKKRILLINKLHTVYKEKESNLLNLLKKIIEGKWKTLQLIDNKINLEEKGNQDIIGLCLFYVFKDCLVNGFAYYKNYINSIKIKEMIFNEKNKEVKNKLFMCDVNEEEFQSCLERIFFSIQNDIICFKFN